MDEFYPSLIPLSLYLAFRRAKKELGISPIDLRNLGAVWHLSEIVWDYTKMNHLAPLRGGRSLTVVYESMNNLERMCLISKARGHPKGIVKKGLAGASSSWWCLSPAGRRLYENFVRIIVESNRQVLANLDNGNRPIKSKVEI